MVKDWKSIRVDYLIPSTEALIWLHLFLSRMGEFIHSTTAKLHIFLILGMVSPLFHLRREEVLGSDS